MINAGLKGSIPRSRLVFRHLLGNRLWLLGVFVVLWPRMSDASFGVNRYHWGISWSSDSQWVLFHTRSVLWEYDPAPADEERMASYRNLLHVPTNSWVSEWRSGEIHQEPQTGRLFVFSRDGLFTALSRTGGWRIAYPPGGWDARYAPAGNIYEMNVQPEAIGEFPRFEPGKDWFHFLLNGATCEETTDTVSLEPESNRSSGVTMRLVDWPGGAWLERRQDKVTLHGRNGQEVLLTDREELDRHRNQGSVAVMEAALSPDQEFAALVVETHPPREDDTFYGTPRYRGIPSGFIVVYKLGDATEAAHVPMITHVGDEYAR